MEFLMQPWPWWLSGVLIGATVPLLFILAGKAFGISTSFQEAGAMCAPCNFDYLRKHKWRSGIWTLVFALGIALGSLIAVQFLSTEPVEFLPDEYYSVGGGIRLFVGGLLIGFGTRYAGGCTSGHSITGIANLNWPSLVATIFFFVGGLAVTWGLGSWLFSGVGE
jgi:uncharacterized membrane protein YedE/YeeE